MVVIKSIRSNERSLMFVNNDSVGKYNLSDKFRWVSHSNTPRIQEIHNGTYCLKELVAYLMDIDSWNQFFLVEFVQKYDIYDGNVLAFENN